ncbi:MAG: hypothetical protein GF363_08755 [Chitinivibrionales bacterium]|nr:hypothetical protein [Chitinivibrionales bacterium]
MTREELKEIVGDVIARMRKESPEPACGVLWSDEPEVTTLYSVGEEDPANEDPQVTTRYAIGEED